MLNLHRIASIALFLSFMVYSCKSALTPSTNGTLRESYDTSFTMNGQRYVKSVSFTNDWGTYSMDKSTFQGVVYEHQYWVGIDLMNIFSISSSGDQIGITYVYCTSSATEDTTIYSEDFEHEMVEESASGSCKLNSNQETSIPVSFPPLTTEPKPSRHSTDIIVTGSQLNIRNSTGDVEIKGVKYDVIVFSTVNCASCPGSTGGWYELHSFLYNSQAQKACFAIFYLFLDNKSSIEMQYALCVPDLSQPDTTYTATWTGKLTKEPIHANSTQAKVHWMMIRDKI